MTQLLDIFPFINKTMLDLEKQNKFLNKVTLIGKINALNVAANLFEFTDKTAVIFDELKVELINALLEENIKKITNELEFKAKTTIDILIRNLFERTADVGFFSTDSVIIDFLTTETISDEIMLTRLQEYASKYSVYNEIVIFDTAGNVKINMNESNKILKSNDFIISDALNSSEYIEKYAQTDIFKSQEKTLMYAQKITYHSKDIGVLCLCFKLEDELDSIFKNLSHNNEILSISDSTNILAKNTKRELHLKQKYKENDYTILNNKYICVSKKTSGYQGYFGITEWYATAIQDSVYATKEFTNNDSEEETSNKNLLSEQLNQIIEKANAIIEDIADVIINGELIASKQKVYQLTPILDNLRTISTELLGSIKSSVKNLELVVEEGLVHDAKMATHLAIDIMDRNLYERANDSRWWALTPLFIQELSADQANTEKLTATLKYINELYTVYTNIFIYDKDGKVIAASNDDSIVGTSLSKNYIAKTLSNTNTQNYYVSEFENSSLYNDKATYIYSASITNKSKIVGGIGVVFDAQAEFLAMLNDSFPSSKNGFMLFLDQDKTIISSNNPALEILSQIEIDDKFVNIRSTHSVYDYLTFKEQEYIVSSVPSKGYREYKTSDNYSNIIFCLVFIEV